MTPRLNELETDHKVAWSLGDAMTTEGKIAGYKLCLKDVEPVLAAAEKVLRDFGDDYEIRFQPLRDALAEFSRD